MSVFALTWMLRSWGGFLSGGHRPQVANEPGFDSFEKAWELYLVLPV